MAIAALVAVAGIFTATADAKSNSPEIEHGDDAPIGVYDYTGALIPGGSSDEGEALASDLFCTTIAIEPQWVLTAAHCIIDEDTGIQEHESYEVITGRTNLLDPSDGYRSRVDAVYVNPGFYSESGLNYSSDIALLHLQSAVPPSHTIEVDDAPVPGGRVVRTLGYGLDENGNEPTWLQERSTTMRSPSSACSYDANLLCISEPIGNFGDSGGPLVDASTGHLVGVANARLPTHNSYVAMEHRFQWASRIMMTNSAGTVLPLVTDNTTIYVTNPFDETVDIEFIAQSGATSVVSLLPRETVAKPQTETGAVQVRFPGTSSGPPATAVHSSLHANAVNRTVLSSYSGVSAGAPSITVPIVHINRGWNSTLHVFNTSRTSVRYTLELSPFDNAPGVGTAVTHTFLASPEVTAVLDLQAIYRSYGHSGEFVGTATVNGFDYAPLVLANRNAFDTRAVQDESRDARHNDDTLALPLIQNNNHNWQSGVAFTKASGNGSTVSLNRYYPEQGATGTHTSEFLGISTGTTLYPVSETAIPTPYASGMAVGGYPTDSWTSQLNQYVEHPTNSADPGYWIATSAYAAIGEQYCQRSGVIPFWRSGASSSSWTGYYGGFTLMPSLGDDGLPADVTVDATYYRADGTAEATTVIGMGNGNPYVYTDQVAADGGSIHLKVRPGSDGCFFGISGILDVESARDGQAVTTISP